MAGLLENYNKKAGALLHISSLPSRYGIGSLGKSAYSFVDFLNKSGLSLWQVLPLTPLSFGNSPYQAPSSSAFNYFLIDLDLLSEQGLLTKKELIGQKSRQRNRVDYELLYASRLDVLKIAFERYQGKGEYQAFLSQKTYFDYALFMALKEKNGGAPWYLWEEKYRFADNLALTDFASRNSREIEFWQWLQFIFLRQWSALKSYANDKGVLIIGDMPIYAARDSVEVWKNPQMFLLDEDKTPLSVAGVPPDYFSKKGQLWGNPLYNWRYMQKDDYAFWKKRIKEALDVYNFVRIDHFRAFSAYYSIPFGSENATRGEWKEGFGKDLFKDLKEENILAEDLGVYDGALKELMDFTGFPSMRVLQFAFDGLKENTHNMENVGRNCVIYSGTHDNDTLMGFLKTLKADKKRVYASEVEKRRENCGIRHFLTDRGLAGAVIELAFASDAAFAIIPMQDFLLRGKKYRMNTPGTLNENNWRYKECQRSFFKALAVKIKNLCRKYGR